MDISSIFSVDAFGKPRIGNSAKDLFAFGHLIRETETLILELFGRGLVSGTTHTCLLFGHSIILTIMSCPIIAIMVIS